MRPERETKERETRERQIHGPQRSERKGRGRERERERKRDTKKEGGWWEGQGRGETERKRERARGRDREGDSVERKRGGLRWGLSVRACVYLQPATHTQIRQGGSTYHLAMASKTKTNMLITWCWRSNFIASAISAIS